MRRARETMATAKKTPARAAWDVRKIRKEFPILSREVHGKRLVYLDNAATSHKPKAVIEAVRNFYTATNSNIHRGIHTLSMEATSAYEAARGKVRRFLNAGEDREIVFVRGTTEAINLVAATYGRSRLSAGDEIVITEMEHHSNIVPWQILRDQIGVVLRVAPISDDGELILEAYESLLGPRTKIVSVVHVSNALGTINPVRRIVEMAHRHGAIAVLDGAQAVPHLPTDVRDLGCDFYAFSGHKLFAPTGVGVLYGKAALLEVMPPYQGGGDMISTVSFEKTTWNRVPYKFEAGTPDVAGVIGLGAAIDYLGSIGRDGAIAWENELLAHATEILSAIPGLRIIGKAREKASVVSFVLDEIHPHDIGTILDQEGIAIRAGHHCTQPLMKRFGVPATARASFAFYNTREEIDALAAGILQVQKVFA